MQDGQEPEEVVFQNARTASTAYFVITEEVLNDVGLVHTPSAKVRFRNTARGTWTSIASIPHTILLEKDSKMLILRAAGVKQCTGLERYGPGFQDSNVLDYWSGLVKERSKIKAGLASMEKAYLLHPKQPAAVHLPRPRPSTSLKQPEPRSSSYAGGSDDEDESESEVEHPSFPTTRPLSPSSHVTPRAADRTFIDMATAPTLTPGSRFLDLTTRERSQRLPSEVIDMKESPSGSPPCKRIKQENETRKAMAKGREKGKGTRRVKMAVKNPKNPPKLWPAEFLVGDVVRVFEEIMPEPSGERNKLFGEMFNDKDNKYQYIDTTARNA